MLDSVFAFIIFMLLLSRFFACDSVPLLDELEMWADAQRDGRSAEYSWRLLFIAAKLG